MTSEVKKTAGCTIVSRWNILKVALKGFINHGDGSCTFKYLGGDGNDITIRMVGQNEQFLKTLERLGLTILKNSTIDFDRQVVEHKDPKISE